MKETTVLVGVAVTYKKTEGREPLWFVIREKDKKEWEFPRTVVRRGESSVRAVVRMTQEQASMQTKVLEEVGRTAGVTKINGKEVNQRVIYYLLFEKTGGEVIGFDESKWVTAREAEKITGKKDQKMIREAKEMSKKIEKEKKHLQEEEEELFEEEIEEEEA